MQAVSISDRFPWDHPSEQTVQYFLQIFATRQYAHDNINASLFYN